jgi:hypothetical protein
MTDQPDLVTLELAPLPREQTGPFILLGLEKSADQEAIEANWAQRVIWSRKKQFRIPLEDVNWAREVINDPQRRVQADVTSLNADTADRTLASLAGPAGTKGPAWQPLDREKDLRDHLPPVEVPAVEDVAAAVEVPEPPRDMPAVRRLLEGLAAEPLDPWGLPVSVDPDKGPSP